MGIGSHECILSEHIRHEENNFLQLGKWNEVIEIFDDHRDWFSRKAAEVFGKSWTNEMRKILVILVPLFSNFPFPKQKSKFGRVFYKLWTELICGVILGVVCKPSNPFFVEVLRVNICEKLYNLRVLWRKVFSWDDENITLRFSLKNETAIKISFQSLVLTTKNPHVNRKQRNSKIDS